MIARLAFVLACLAPWSVARAAIDLQWSAPPRCPDAAHARATLLEHLHHEDPPDARARVEIAAHERGWIASVTIDAGEPRTLTGRDCEALMRAAVLVVAVAIDPVAVVGPGLPVVMPEPAGEPPIVPEPGPVPTSTPAPTRARFGSADRITEPPRRSDRDLPSEHALRIAGGVSYAIVPAITGAVQIAYALQRPRWRLEALASYVPPRELQYDDGTGAGGRVQAIAFAVRGCPSPRLANVRLPICLGLEGGPVLGRGVGVAEVRRPVTGWLAASAGLGVIARVHRVVALTVHLDLFATILRPVLFAGAREPLFRAPIPGGRAMLGLEFALR